MRQCSSRRVRPRPNSRNENLTSPISSTESSSPFDQSSDILPRCSNIEERLPELPNDASNHKNVNERRTRSERYNSLFNVFFTLFLVNFSICVIDKL